MRLGVISVGQAGDAPRIFEHRVLKSAANAKEWKAGHGSLTHGCERAIEARVRTSGREQNRVDQREPRVGIRRECRRRDPAPLQRMLAQLANMTECFVDGEMRVHRRVIVSDDGEACGNRHVYALATRSITVPAPTLGEWHGCSI